MYDADPFTARQEVAERQAKATQKRDGTMAQAGGTRVGGSALPNGLSQAPEVKMATALRELAEATIKKVTLPKLDLKHLLTSTRPSLCIQPPPKF